MDDSAFRSARKGRKLTGLKDAHSNGSPDTIANAFKRFWRDLAPRIEGYPVALTRMPPDIAELADGMWQRALPLAGEAAKH